jgi:hypothetical protein
MLSRRAFLAQSAALAAGASVGGYPVIAPAQQSSGGWGDLSELLPGTKPYKVLEIHLEGGLSPWETFYVRLGQRGLDWRGFEAKVKATEWPHAGSDNQQNLCRFSPASGTGTMPFDTTHTDHPIHLGPATAPLWRDDILKRMRVVVLQHDLLPHEAAIPYAATGLRLGRPQMAGMGAAVQARRKAIDPDGKTPAAYVCLSDAAASGNDAMQAFWSSGQLGGGARPVVLRVGGGDQFVQRLERENANDGNSTERFDDLLTAYRNAYAGLMQPPLPGDGPIPIRSKGFVEYDAALRMLKNAKELHSILTGSGTGLFDEINDGGCVRLHDGALGAVTLNTTRMALTAAAALLRPPGNAGYACVIDSGRLNEAGTRYDTYDTHFNKHVEVTFANLYNTLASLRALIDLQLIDLDSTLIVLSTEFGRTPTPSATHDGRDHWPQGYTAALIGGPIAAVDPPDAPFNSGSAARVLGRIEDATSVAAARSVFTATDLRAAAVLAAGINPFTGDYINQGDLSKCMFPSSEESKFTLMRLRSTFFGDSWQPDTCPDPV